MCLCEELLDRNFSKVVLFQVNLCESSILLQTEVGRVESDSELGEFGVYIFLSVLGIQVWKFTSHQIAAFLYMIEKVW